GVVATGPVGTRDAEIEFLFVIELALNVHAHGADRDNHGTFARNFTSKIDGIAARSLGSNQYRIGAASSRVLEAQVPKFGGGNTGGVSTQAQSQLAPLSDDVHPQNTTTCRFEHLNGKLTQQSKTDHRDKIAQLHISGTNSVQTDGSHRGESGVFERYVRTFRKLGNEQTGNTGNFGVDG